VERELRALGCEPAASCAPAGTEPLHLKCRSTGGNCAVFLERNRAVFEAAGYTVLFGGSPSSVLGFAYAVLDSDRDGLPDAMEQLLGSSPLHVDSDGDGVADGVEYPSAGAPLSDPCAPLQGHVTFSFAVPGPPRPEFHYAIADVPPLPAGIYLVELYVFC
jgi:serine protease